MSAQSIASDSVPETVCGSACSRLRGCAGVGAVCLVAGSGVCRLVRPKGKEPSRRGARLLRLNPPDICKSAAPFPAPPGMLTPSLDPSAFTHLDSLRVNSDCRYSVWFFWYCVGRGGARCLVLSFGGSGT